MLNLKIIKKNIAIALKGKKGSAEKSAKISAARKGKATNKGVSPPKYTCPHCGSSVSMGNYNRWHGERCKMIDPIGHNKRVFQVTNLNKK